MTTDKERIMCAVRGAEIMDEIGTGTFGNVDGDGKWQCNCILGVAMLEAIGLEGCLLWDAGPDWTAFGSVARALGVESRPGFGVLREITMANDEENFERAIELLEAAIPADLVVKE